MVCHHYRKKAVSQDYKKPTRLEVANSTYMVAPRTNVVSGQASTNLHIRAKSGDILRWRGYSDLDADTLVYDVVGSNAIISKNTFEMTEKSAVQPEEFPTVTNPLTLFTYVQAKILKKGTMNYKVRFALYDRGTSFEQERLFGYFEFDAQLKIDF